MNNCREDENMLLSPYKKKSLYSGCFLKSRPNLNAGAENFIYSGTHVTGDVPKY